MGDSNSKHSRGPTPVDEKRTKDGKKKRKRRPGEKKKKKAKPTYTVEEVQQKIDEGAERISDPECFRELISQLSHDQQGEFLDLILIQQEELLEQYRQGASVLQPTISPTSAAEYERKKKAGLIDPNSSVSDDLKQLVDPKKSPATSPEKKAERERQRQSVKDFCEEKGEAGAGKKDLTREERMAGLREYLANLKLTGAGSDSSSDGETDDEYEADFEGKSLERVSQEADFALAEAMKMLEMGDGASSKMVAG
ncbi:unnamed protein product [Amoebophrya sp. A25]|nr:unnamed protein product [Amoebophrya sp. A25]|eukprot:GSA25T00016985001.1